MIYGVQEVLRYGNRVIEELNFLTQGQYRMGITTGGNVGIGTDNPQSKLHVVGDIFSNNYIVPYNQYIGAALSDAFKYKKRSMGHYALSWMNDSWSSGGSTLWQSGYGWIKFFTQGQYRMAITQGGNVGIGTDNPQYSFDVYGNSRITDNLYLGKQLSLSAGGEVVRMSIVPYRHTGGPWNFVSRDTPTQAYLDISYNIYQMFSLTYFNGKGKVGIGVKDPQCELDVKGTIRATEVKIEDISNWSDFVFDTDYKLPLLSEVETHINIHRHLPDVPSQAQVKEEGINVVEMQAKLLQKIEELTLYVIKQDKEINELKKALPHNSFSKGEGSH